MTQTRKQAERKQMNDSREEPGISTTCIRYFKLIIITIYRHHHRHYHHHHLYTLSPGTKKLLFFQLEIPLSFKALKY